MNERLNSEYQFVVDRVEATIACQNLLAPKWVWGELDAAGFKNKLDLLEEPPDGLARQLVRAVVGEDGARIDWDVTLKELHDQTVTAVGAARVRWRKSRPEREIVSALSAGAQDRAGRQSEADDLVVAWEEVDAAWEPVPGLTLAGFTALAEQARAQGREARRLEYRRRRAEGLLMVGALELQDLAQAWYAMATSVFPTTNPDTRVEAEMLAALPTTYTLAKRRRGRPKKVSVVDGAAAPS